MAKTDVIEKYKDEFLRDKTPEAVANFWQRSIDNQYAAIMYWRRQKNQSSVGNKKNTDVETLMADIKKLCSDITKVQDLSIADYQSLMNNIDFISEQAKKALGRYYKRRLGELEQKQMEIEQQISDLIAKQSAEDFDI